MLASFSSFLFGSPFDADATVALLSACRVGDLNSVKEALSQKADPDAATFRKHRDVPVVLAAAGRHSEIVRALIDAGCDVECKDHRGSALHRASRNDDTDMVQLLLEAGANVNSTRLPRCGTPLAEAVEVGASLATIRALLEVGADLSVPSAVPINRPILMIINLQADDSSLLEVFDALLRAGANVGAVDGQGNGVLHRMAGTCSKRVLHRIIDGGADVCARNVNHETPLHWAGSHVVGIDVLLRAGADVNAQNNCGSTALHRAHERDAASALLKGGADIHLVDARGRTPLHEAFDNGRMEVARLLLQKGAHVHLVDNDGKLPHELHSRALITDIDEMVKQGLQRVGNKIKAARR